MASIKQDDSAVNALVSHLSRDPASTGYRSLFARLIGMLGSSRNAEGPAARSLEWPPRKNGRWIKGRWHSLSFASVTEPAPEVDDWLRQLHQRQDDLSNSSLLLLATMGDRVREQDPERFQSISQYVVAAANAPDLNIAERSLAWMPSANLGRVACRKSSKALWLAMT